MPNCPGKQGSRKCYATLYRCKACGHVGCEHFTPNARTNQAFYSGKCTRCGKSGQKEMLK